MTSTKMSLKSVFALLQTLSRVFYLVHFDKCWRIFRELISKLYQSQEKKKRVVLSCVSRPPQNEKLGSFTSYLCSEGNEMYKKA